MDEGHVQCKYKHWVDDEDWKPAADEAPINMFKLDENGEEIVPQGSPDVLAPDFELKSADHLNKLGTSIKAQKQQFSFEHFEFWENWAKKPAPLWEPMSSKWAWPLEHMLPIYSEAAEANTAHEVADVNNGMQQEEDVLQEQVEAATANPIQIIRRKELTAEKLYSTRRKPVFSIKNSVSKSLGKYAVYKLKSKDNKIKVGKIMQNVPGGKVKVHQFEGNVSSAWKKMPAHS